MNNKGKWCPYGQVLLCQESAGCWGCQIYLERLGADRDKKQDALKVCAQVADIKEGSRKYENQI